MPSLVGIDTGGTFTDLIGYEPQTAGISLVKVPSTPASPADAVTAALRELGSEASQIKRIVLGTTIAINAILQRRGADVIFLTTAGFEDIPYIQRISRPHLYDLQWQKQQPLVRRAFTIGVGERVDHRGTVIRQLDESELQRVVDAVREKLAGATEPAIAICLLFAYVNATHEELLAEALQTAFPSVPVSLSSRVAPIWREYERESTTLADAYVKPLLAGFATTVESGVHSLGIRSPVALMKSNGGLTPADRASDHSSDLVLSGLTGGLLAGKYYAELLERPRLITLDMGGTSADVGVIKDGEVSYTESYDIAWALPIIGSFIDMTSIGAGGSSIAGFDRGGFLKVGPESSGADPGPAAYGRGGKLPTVTDANLLLGRLDPDFFLGGKMPLHTDLAREALAPLARVLGATIEDASLAVIRMANENMANAIRLVTVDRGLDHRQFDLLAFGGAGPVHAAELASALGMSTVVVPLHPGLTSAFGLMLANPRVDRRWTRMGNSETTTGAMLHSAFDRLVKEALSELRQEGYDGDVRIVRTVSMRYVGQNYEQEIAIPDGNIDAETVPVLVEQFHRHHEAFYGYAMRDNVCELAQFNVTVEGVVSPPKLPTIATRKSAKQVEMRKVYYAGIGWLDTPIYMRQELGSGQSIDGPAVVQEVDSTTVLHPGQRLTVDKHGVMFLNLAPVEQSHQMRAEVAR